MEGNMEELLNKMALKELVDTFSNLADVKDVEKQSLLFSEDAMLISHRDGKVVSKQVGREAIKKACGNYLSLFETVYHMNGQQVVEINGDKATGIAYCLVVLIKPDQTKLIQGVRYEDQYIKIDGRWYIETRNSYFMLKN